MTQHREKGPFEIELEEFHPRYRSVRSLAASSGILLGLSVGVDLLQLRGFVPDFNIISLIAAHVPAFVSVFLIRRGIEIANIESDDDYFRAMNDRLN